jgi:hypothetical protein
MEKKKSLYESLWDKGKEIVKELNKPIARKRDKRAFEAAVDEAADQGYQARQRLNKALESKIGHYADNIDDMVRDYRTEIASKEAVRDIKALYQEIFGKELKTEE